MKNNNANITKPPVYSPPNGVRTPLELLTALLDNEPVPGNACTNELATFDKPIANNSCVASTGLPFAKYVEKIPYLIQITY